MSSGKKLRLCRITASKVAQCMKHINEAGNVVGTTHSTVAALFGYYGDVMGSALLSEGPLVRRPVSPKISFIPNIAIKHL